MEKILVVTATLGNRESLKRTIQSVKDIGKGQVKHIIVAPNKVIPFLKAQYNGIDFLSEPEGKKGIYAAINHGFKSYGKNYEYLTFINDDDYWLPNFRLLIDETNKHYDLIYGKIEYILSDKKQKIKQMACSNQLKDFIPLLYSHIVLFTQQATLVKSDLYFQLGGFSEKYQLVSDTKFWADLSLLNIKYKYVSQACAAYTIQQGQLSSNKFVQKQETDELLSQLPKPTLLKKYWVMIKYRIINLPVYIRRMKLHEKDN